MQSIDAQDLGIGLTGVKKKCGAHLSYMTLARADGPCFPFSLHAAAAPHSTRAAAALAYTPPSRLHRSRRAPYAPRAVRHPRRRPKPPPRAACTTAARAPPARARAARLRHHLLFAAATACHSALPPRTRAAADRHRAAHAAAPFTLRRSSLSHSVRAKCSAFCLIEMGREKRKGKEVVVEKPARKWTRTEREAERAEMVAKAAEEQVSGHARPFAIREQPARGRGRGRGMGRVRGARATRATTEAASESDHSDTAADSDADSEAAQSEQSQGQSTQGSPTVQHSGRTR